MVKRLAICVMMFALISSPAFAKGGHGGGKSSSHSGSGHSRVPTGGYGTGSKSSSTSVKGHVTNKGTHVAPHNRTIPDKSKSNNYSAKGNVNTHNGKVGTKYVK